MWTSRAAALGVGCAAAVSATGVSASPWTYVHSMDWTRWGHRAVVLSDGRVLATGGRDLPELTNSPLNACEIYDPIQNIWMATRPMLAARAHHVAVRLRDGRVLVAGGENASGYPLGAEVWSPVTGVWSAAGNLSVGRAFASVFATKDGEVLVIGGNDGAAPHASTELWNSTTSAWSTAATLTTGREHAAAVDMDDGSVVVVGGRPALATVEQWPPWVLWSANLTSGRQAHGAARLELNSLVVAGGRDPAGGPSQVVRSTEVYIPTVGAWTIVAERGGVDNTVTRLRHGAHALVAGGAWDTGGWRVLADSFVVGTAGLPGIEDFLNEARTSHEAVLLHDGRVLAIGGCNWVDPGTGACTNVTSSVESWDPCFEPSNTGDMNDTSDGLGVCGLTEGFGRGGIVSDTGFPPDMLDHWHLTLDRPRDLAVTLSSSGTFRIRLLNAAGIELASTFGSAAGGLVVAAPNAPPGTYYVAVHLLSPMVGGGQYGLVYGAPPATFTSCVGWPIGTLCDDGDLCTPDERCDGLGACVGTIVTCVSDAGLCGTQRACDGSATCAVSVPSAGVSCDDGNPCTGGDLCDGFGGCLPGAEDLCPGGTGSGDATTPTVVEVSERPLAPNSTIHDGGRAVLAMRARVIGDESARLRGVAVRLPGHPSLRRTVEQVHLYRDVDENGQLTDVDAPLVSITPQTSGDTLGTLHFEELLAPDSTADYLVAIDLAQHSPPQGCAASEMGSWIALVASMMLIPMRRRRRYPCRLTLRVTGVALLVATASWAGCSRAGYFARYDVYIEPPQDVIAIGVTSGNRLSVLGDTIHAEPVTF